MKEVIISGTGTYPVVGSYDDAAETFRRMSDYGLNGMAVGLVNYIGDFPMLRDEVLPRLERLGPGVFAVPRVREKSHPCIEIYPISFFRVSSSINRTSGCRELR